MTDPYDAPGYQQAAPYQQAPHQQAQGYSGPPPTGYPPPPDPHGAPGYAYPPAYVAAYPAVYPYGYAPIPPGERRPGMLTGAAVLAYVQAGFLILAGLFLFSGSSISNDLNGSHSSELALDGALNLLCAGLLIAGAIMASSRSNAGRLLYSAGSAIVLGLTVYWQTRWHDDLVQDGVLFWGGLFATLMVVGTALLWTPDVTKWITARKD